MSSLSGLKLDLINNRLDEERETIINRASETLKINGTKHCVDCDKIIPDLRRQAAPFAIRCIHCARDYERG